MKDPEDETYTDSLYNDRTLLETALALDKRLDRESVFYPGRLKLFKEIYIGHTPTTRFEVTTPLHAGNLWNMDTGAANRGRISVMDIETKEYLQSDKTEDIYI